MKSPIAEKADDGSLSILWADGRKSFIAAETLLKNCPCIRCQGKIQALSAEIFILKVMAAGRFGLRLVFSSGCQRGIYSWQQLAQFTPSL